MYNLYCENEENPVSRKIYECEFRKLILSFKERKTDTCHKCDVFHIKIQVKKSEDEKKITRTINEALRCCRSRV